MTSPKIQELKRELEKIRHASLMATRQNDFMRVANLTVKAAQLNRTIVEIEDQLIESTL